METPERANWIGGRAEPPAGGQTFATVARVPPWGPTGRWPRSGAADAQRALEAGEAAAPGWATLGRVERLRRLVALHGRLEEELDLTALARGLGLGPDELRARSNEELFRFREGLELLADGGDGFGAGVFQAHWSDLVGGLAARLAARLAAGNTAVVFSDPALPQAGEVLAAAAVAAELPEGVVSVLHGDTSAALEAGLRRPGLAWARLRGPVGELAELVGRLGALDESWAVWPLGNASYVVAGGADPGAEAAAVVEKAFGRSSTISGQFPGHVGRVLCHQRLFSRFSEELLRCLEAAPDVLRPVPAIDPDLRDHVRSAWALGLDEGATPIFGGEPLSRPAVPVDPSGEEESAGSRPPPVVPPVVFTNVEVGQRLARRGRPAPVLALLRASDDEAARRLAAEIDERSRRSDLENIQSRGR